MTDFKDELLEVLKRDAYKKGEFKLSSGRESNHYVNCKPVTLSGRGLTLSSLLLLKELEHSHYVRPLLQQGDAKSLELKIGERRILAIRVYPLQDGRAERRS